MAKPLTEPQDPRCKGHRSMRSCAICKPHNRKRWYNRMAADPKRYARYLANSRRWNAKHSRAIRVCPNCGKERQYNHVLCDECKKEFRAWSRAASARRAFKAGKRPNYKAQWLARVAKYGHEALALANKVRYHERKKRKERGVA